MKSYEKLVNKFPCKETYRSAFYKFRSKLRRTCKKEERNYKRDIYAELSKNMDKNPKTFWNLINKLDNKTNNNNDIYTCNDEFTQFYKNLNKNDQCTNKIQDKIIKEFEELRKKLSFKHRR